MFDVGVKLTCTWGYRIGRPSTSAEQIGIITTEYSYNYAESITMKH